MKKVLEVQMGTHYINTKYGVEKCAGTGKWSQNKIDHVVETGTNIMASDWSAECPSCRKVVPGFDSRIRLPIKEMFLPVKEMVTRVVKAVGNVAGR